MVAKKNGWSMVVGAVLLTGCAGGKFDAGLPVAGTVTGVYGEPVPGILMSRDLRGRRSADDPVWVDVRMAEPLGDGRDRVLARIDDRDVIAGDRVDLTLPGPGEGSVRPQDAGPVLALGLPFQREGLATRTAAPRVAEARRRLRVEVEPDPESRAR